VRPWLAAVAAGLLVVSCATAPPKTLVRESASYETATPPNVDQLGVFVDGFVQYDSMSGKYVDLADSRTAITTLAAETKSALTEKGYVIDFTDMPFVGGLLEDASDQVVEDRHADPKPMVPPFEMRNTVDAADVTGLRNISHDVAIAFAHPAWLSNTRAWSPAARSGLAQIAAQQHIRYLLVVLGEGVVESGWKEAAEGVGTAALTALATLGTVAISVRHVSSLDSYAVLIDLQSSEVLWSNAIRLSNFDSGDPKDYQKSGWSRQLFYYLPSRRTGEKMSAK
jgi:hypothetical protein